MLIDQLERDLFNAAGLLARRRRRRRRASLLLVPSIACAVAVAVVAQAPDQRPGTAEAGPTGANDAPAAAVPAAAMRLAAQRLGGELPSADTLVLIRERFSVFRRAARPEDRVPSGDNTSDGAAPHLNQALIRLTIHRQGVTVYAAPVRRAGNDEICIVAVSDRDSGSACAPIASAVTNQQPLGLLLSGAAHEAILVRLLPDSVRNFRVEGARLPIAVVGGENVAVAAVDPAHGFSQTWEDESGRRYSFTTPGTGS